MRRQTILLFLFVNFLIQYIHSGSPIGFHESENFVRFSNILRKHEKQLYTSNENRNYLPSWFNFFKKSSNLEKAARDWQSSNSYTFDKFPPQNISNLYKGIWNRDTGSLYNSSQQHGELLVHLGATENIMKEFHFIEGEVGLRDGYFIHNQYLHLFVQGVYSLYTGKFFFYFVPAHKALVTIDDQFNDTGATLAYKLGMTHRIPKLLEERTRNPRLFRGNKGFDCIWKGFATAELVPNSEYDSETDSIPFRKNLVPLKLINLKGNLKAIGDCNGTVLDLDLESYSLESFVAKAELYSLLATLATIFEILALVYQMHYTKTQTTMARVSALTIGMQAIMDSYICFIHLTFGIYVAGAFKAFAISACLKFILFSLFELRYLVEVFKAATPSNFSDNAWNETRRELQFIYTRFYATMLIGFIIVYQFNFLFNYALFVLFSFWAPQIYVNFKRDTRKPLHPVYIFGNTICRVIIPLYFFLCPSNFTRIEPNPILISCLFGWLCLQVFFLMLQHWFGSRWFIPKALRPQKYDYHRPIPAESLENGECNCVICMHPIKPEENDQHMVTPCNHVFHSECLNRWMEEKMICPTCRANLPND